MNDSNPIQLSRELHRGTQSQHRASQSFYLSFYDSLCNFFTEPT